MKNSFESVNHIILFLCNLLFFSLLSVSGKNNPKVPNLVLILVDDLGYADLGIHGSKQNRPRISTGLERKELFFLEPPGWRIRHLGFYDAEYQLVQPE